MSRKFLIAGNWKMNLTPDESAALVDEINSLTGSPDQCPGLCMPALHIPPCCLLQGRAIGSSLGCSKYACRAFWCFYR